MSSRGSGGLAAPTIDGHSVDDIRKMNMEQVRELSPEAQAEWLTNGMGQIQVVVRGLDLSGTDLSNSTLGTTPNRGFRSFEDCKFDNANLYQAEFADTRFNTVSFREANLEHAVFSSSSFQRTVFDDANLLAANFTDTSGSTNKTQPIGTAVSFRDANLEGAIFEHALMYRASFSGADLTNANFTGPADAFGNPTDAVLIESDFSHATGLYSAKFTTIQMNRQNLNFDGADFTP